MVDRGFKVLARLTVAIAMVAGLGARSAEAGEREVSSQNVRAVVELFTSQGCSSCPKGDRVFADLAKDPTIVALAYHIDYWDYIGWADPHGSPANTERQRAYAGAFGTGSIYTPQVVVNGTRDLVGSQAQPILDAVEETKLTERSGNPWVSLTLRDDRLHVAADGPKEAGPRPARPPILMLVTFGAQSETTVSRGENRGRTLLVTNPVRDWRILGMWDGKRLDVDLPLSALRSVVAGKEGGGKEGGRKGGCAAILQSMTDGGAPGPILAAVALDF